MRSDMAAFAVRGARSRDRQMGTRAQSVKMLLSKVEAISALGAPRPMPSMCGQADDGE
jgi:hypothetical protein